jgi:NDP-sugar pyrophosphorylase family protein
MSIQFSESHWSKSWAHRRHEQSNIRCTILAAGLGKRLEPLTARYIPKPLFPLGGKVPMVETWIRKMIESGITDLSMNLCVLKSTIKERFGSGSRFGVNISYVEEDVPSGTLGGVCKQVLGRNAKTLHGQTPPDIEPFQGGTVIAPSGDIVTNFGPDLLQELYDVHKQAGAAFTMVLVPIPSERRKDFGTAVLTAPKRRDSLLGSSGRISEFREKDPNSPSNLNNASIYIMETRLLNELDQLRTEATLDAADPFYDFGKHVFPALLGNLPYAKLAPDNLLWGAEYTGEWFDVGQKRDYLRVNEHVLDGALDVDLPFEKLPWGYLGTAVEIDFDRVTIIPPVVIGNGCVVEAGAFLGPYAVIGDDWTIRSGASIRNSVLWERYPMFRDTGGQVSPDQMRRIDRHEICAGVTVNQSIVAGGMIETDVHDSTVEVLDGGRISVSPMDYQPSGARA